MSTPTKLPWLTSLHVFFDFPHKGNINKLNYVEIFLILKEIAQCIVVVFLTSILRAKILQPLVVKIVSPDPCALKPYCYSDWTKTGLYWIYVYIQSMILMWLSQPEHEGYGKAEAVAKLVWTYLLIYCVIHQKFQVISNLTYTLFH